jgi:uncharacterized repeat protein (TIGR01451 family)
MRLIKRAAVVAAMSLTVIGVPATSAQAFTLFLPDQFLGTFPALPFIASMPITNNNDFGVTIQLDSLTITPTDPDDVLIIDASDCLGRPIPNGSSCTVSATVIPSSTGTHTAHVVASGPSIQGIPLPVDLSFNVSVDLVEPDIDIGQIDLGDQEIGVPISGSLTFTSGFPADITILNASVVVGGPNASDITSFDISECVGTIEPGESCSLKATATVGGEGPRSATFVITADINGIASTLRGTVLANGVPAPATVSPASLAFGGKRIRTSASLSATLQNTTGVQIVVQSISVGGPDAGDFTVVSDGCTGVPMPWHSSCSITVMFTPSDRGPRAADVLFDIDRLDVDDVSLPLQGTGLAPVGDLDTNTLDLGRVPNGEASVESYVTLRNVGDVSMHVSTVTIDGFDASSFLVADDTCEGITLAVGRSCTVAVSFTPHSIGPKEASLRIENDTVPGVELVALTGTGTSSADVIAGLRPSTTTPSKNSTLTYTLKVRNAGPNSAVGTWVSLDLPDGIAFVSTSVTCTTPDAGDNGTVWCRVGRLRSGDQSTISVVGTVAGAKGAALEAVARAGASTFDPFTGNNKVSRTVLVS